MKTGRLENKVALVTGAGGGIGQGIAVRFAAEGCSVGILDYKEQGIADTVRTIEAMGGHAVALHCDLRNASEVSEAVILLRQVFGPINVLVNNAAVMPLGTLHETSVEDWENVFAVNVRGTYFVCREVVPDMLENGGGSIINMASITGVRGLVNLAAYSATKGALIALTRAMSTDYARFGIRVNSVSPGTIDSTMLRDFLATHPEALERNREPRSSHPMGRVGLIEEVTGVFVFLASDEASFVSGADYRVDGGMSAKSE